MNQKGQTLVITIFVMLVALSAGVIISSRYFKSLHTFTKSDNASKATYVAESLAERLLSQSNETLNDYVVNNSCGDNCYLGFEDGSEAYAEVSVLGNSTDTYSLKGIKDSVVQINLEGYDANSYIDICWNENSSVTAMYIYGDSSIDSYAYNAVTSMYDSDFEMASPNYAYANCFRVDTKVDSIILRLKALYEDAYFNVIPYSGSVLPSQGFLIKSTGRFWDIYKTVSVAKKHTLAPEIFDYVIYQKSEETSLSK